MSGLSHVVQRVIIVSKDALESAWDSFVDWHATSARWKVEAVFFFGGIMVGGLFL